MKVTYGFSPDTSALSLTRSLKSLDADPTIQKWLCSKLYPLLCTQDIVHLGVKLKSRLLKPTIILPFGKFIASSAHFHILVGQKGKDVHGLRRQDLDHKDKQNFDAVEHIIKVSHLLDTLPDAIGTKAYIDLIGSCVYSFLDKTLSPEKRLEEIWFAVSFIRYWRQWLSIQPKFTLKKQFYN